MVLQRSAQLLTAALIFNGSLLIFSLLHFSSQHLMHLRDFLLNRNSKESHSGRQRKGAELLIL